MKSLQQGFTLIELMIVIAIIGILAAIAIPAYQGYTIRAQVSEGSSLIGGLETAFDECYANKGSAANCNTNKAVGITSTISGTYVKSATFANPGEITVTYNSNANANVANKTINWFAYQSGNGDITWLCNDGTSTTKALSATGLKIVTGGTAATTGNTITDPSYLPLICQ